MKQLLLFFLFNPLCWIHECLSQVTIPVLFVAESIDFKYTDGIFRVNGIYSFEAAGTTPSGVDLIYPLPFGPAELDTIMVFNMNKGISVPFLTNNKSIRFNIQVNPGIPLKINIAYRQRIFSDTLHYILTSTAKWGKPLRTAVYRFVCDEPDIRPRFSYPPDTVFNIQNQPVYLWKKTEFIPDQDFLIYIGK